MTVKDETSKYRRHRQQTRNSVIYPIPSRSMFNKIWKTEQVNVVEFSDEDWVGVKG